MVKTESIRDMADRDSIYASELSPLHPSHVGGALPPLAFLDFLRATAALMVFVYHAAIVFEGLGNTALFPSLAQGRNGVALFFALSGYLIYASLDATLAKFDEGKVSPQWYLSFWVRRFFRIYPLYLLSLVVVLACSPEWRTAYHIPNLLVHILGLHSFSRDMHGAFNGVLWSLSIEIQFYSIAPFVYLAVRRLSNTALGVLAIMLWTASYLIFRYGLVDTLKLWTTNGEPDHWSYFIGLHQLPSSLLFFAVGFLSYRLRAHTVPRWLLGATGFIFLALPYVVQQLKTVGLHGPGWEYFVEGLYGLCFIPPLVYAASFRGDKELWVRLIRWVSDISYSFYVWHLLIINLAQVHFGTHTIWFKSIISLVATLIVSDFTARHVEKRGINFGKKLARRLWNRSSGAMQNSAEQ